MDRTLACGADDVGSIPTGSTKDTNTRPAASFVLLGWAQRYFVVTKSRAGVESEFSDEKIRLVTTKYVKV